MTTDTRTLVQCDFDGTVVVEDISFAILDAFANGDWRSLFQEYMRDVYRDFFNRALKLKIDSLRTLAIVTPKAHSALA